MRWRLLTIPLLITVGLTSFWLARQLNPGAFLVGPFLLLSPLIALAIVALPSSFRREPHEKYRESEELRDRVNELEHGLKKAPKVLLFADAEYPSQVSVSGNYIYVNTAKWEDLSWAERDFLLARGVAKLEGQTKWKGIGWLILAGQILAGVVAALNLWSILVIHAVTAVLLFRGSIAKAKAKELEADRRAVVLTGNKAAALRVLRAQDKEDKYAFVPLAERVAAIESAIG